MVMTFNLKVKGKKIDQKHPTSVRKCMSKYYELFLSYINNIYQYFVIFNIINRNDNINIHINYSL